MNASGKDAKIVGWLLPKGTIEALDSFFTESMKYLSVQLELKGYNLALFNEENYNLEKFVSLLRDKMLSGLILFSPTVKDEERINNMKNSGIPLAVMYSHYSGIDSFTCDNVFGGYLAAMHLIERRKKRIALILGSNEWMDSVDRLEGFKQALAATKNEFYPWLVKSGFNDYYRGKIVAQEFMAIKDRPDAIFACNDKMAMGAISAIKQAGFTVPGDIAVIGYDDIPESQYSELPLTTIAQPIKEIAEKLADRIVEVMEGRADPAQAVFEALKPKLVVRSST